MIDIDTLCFIYKGRIGKRRCYRVYHPDLSLELVLDKGDIERFEVKDLSTFGVAFYPGKYKDEFFVGKKLSLSIVFKGTYIVKNIEAQVIRIYKKKNFHNKSVVCCKFTELHRELEYAIDELCVSIQKELLSLSKKEKE